MSVVYTIGSTTQTLYLSPEQIPPLFATMGALFMFSFFFSGTETALFSLQKLDQQYFSQKGRTGHQILRFLKERGTLITTILIGNESVNVALAAVSAILLTHYSMEPWVNIILLTPILVLVSEITPKVLAFRFSRRWATLAIWPLSAFYWVILPIRVVFATLVSSLSSLFGVKHNASMKGLAEDELMILVDRGAESGEVAPMERDMIEAIFEFDDLTVGRLMTPRPDLFSLSIDTPWASLIEQCRTARFSRIPIYGEKSDDILGVLLLKDLLKVRSVPLSGPRQLRSLLIPPIFVPSTKSADAMLREFLDRKIHMVFVVNEHGTLTGLVTLDDLLDELIGELEPSASLSEPTEEAEVRWKMKAGLPIHDFLEETGLELPDGDFHTLGGFVFHEMGHLPKNGDVVLWGGFSFRVLSMEGRRISEVEVKSETLPAGGEE